MIRFTIDYTTPMEDMDAGKPGITLDELRTVAYRLREKRVVHRKALQDVSDEMRGVARRCSAEGMSDAEVARAMGVAVTTVRHWFGKGRYGEDDR